MTATLLHLNTRSEVESEPLMAVSEVFGPTVQGEGPSCGRQAVFLRLAMCNLKCSWCDTKYTWDFTPKGPYRKEDEVHLMSVAEVVEQINSRSPLTELLVITGGEPLLQHRTLEELVEQVSHQDIEIETNGTVMPLLSGRITYNVSPKLSNSGDYNTFERRLKLKVLGAFLETPEPRFKFVCERIEDLDQVEDIVDNVGISDDLIWIMPQAQSAWELQNGLRYLADAVIERGWNLTTRLHIELWNDRRGK